MTKKRTMGRPPAPWMYDLAMGKHLKKNERISYADIGIKYKVPTATVRTFCRKLTAKGEYYFDGRRVWKKYSAMDIQKAAYDYVQQYERSSSKSL